MNIQIFTIKLQLVQVFVFQNIYQSLKNQNKVSFVWCEKLYSRLFRWCNLDSHKIFKRNFAIISISELERISNERCANSTFYISGSLTFWWFYPFWTFWRIKLPLQYTFFNDLYKYKQVQNYPLIKVILPFLGKLPLVKEPLLY